MRIRTCQAPVILILGFVALLALPLSAGAQTGYPPGPTTTVVGGTTTTVVGQTTIPGTIVSPDFESRPSGGQALSFTGAYHIAGLSELAAVLAILGAALVYATRRRRDEYRPT